LQLLSQIYKRGPIACGVNAEPMVKYMGGIFNDTNADTMLTHYVSIIGALVLLGHFFYFFHIYIFIFDSFISFLCDFPLTTPKTNFIN
jgi:hypothetical protein